MPNAIIKTIHQFFLKAARAIVRTTSPTYKKLRRVEAACAEMRKNTTKLKRQTKELIRQNRTLELKSKKLERQTDKLLEKFSGAVCVHTNDASGLQQAMFPHYQQTVLVVTFGRTGSTLLQGIINSIPEACVRGENGHLGFGLYKAYADHFMHWHRFKNKNTARPARAWFGSMEIREDVFINDLRLLFLKQLYPGGSTAKILGFKEIRYLDLNMRTNYPESLFNLLDFYRRMFVNTKFIFHTREYEKVVQSKWWARQNPETLRSSFARFDEAAALYSAKNQDCCYHTRYETLIENGEEVESLFHFLGAHYCKDRVGEVLSIRHSS